MTKCDLSAARSAGTDDCDFSVKWLLWKVTWKWASNRRYLLLFLLYWRIVYWSPLEKQELVEVFTSWCMCIYISSCCIPCGFFWARM